MRKTFKYRAYASPRTLQNASLWLNLCRNLYNTALEQRVSAYKHHRRSVSKYAQMKELPALKDSFPEYKQVGSQVLQEVVERLDKSYRGFFRRVKNGEKAGYPRFKGRNRYNSFILKQCGWRLEGNRLFIGGVGALKLRLSRPIEGSIKTVTVCRSPAGKWYVCFSCDDVSLKPLPPSDKSVGIDVGLMSFLTMSDGTKVGNPRFFKKSQDALAMKQRRLSKRVKGSNRRTKARVLVAKASEKVVNQRRDFHFKLVNQLLKHYGIICIEKMDAWNSSKGLNRSMRDVAWFGFFDILRSKAEEAGREVIEVPAKNTSQLCSQCGRFVPKDLSVRIHSCPSCGLTIDRDINAARNILRLGLSLQANSLAPA